MKRLFILLALVLLASCTNPESTERQSGPDGPSPNSSPSSSPYSEPTGPPLPTISPTTANALRPTGAQKARVGKNVDGDTIWAEPLETGSLPMGAAHKIRILEIDTPEIYGASVECYGPEASAFAKQEIPVGSTVSLLPDKDDKDRYGRFLRYVWKENSEFYNDKAVRLGYAKASSTCRTTSTSTRCERQKLKLRPTNEACGGSAESVIERVGLASEKCRNKNLGIACPKRPFCCPFMSRKVILRVDGHGSAACGSPTAKGTGVEAQLRPQAPKAAKICH